MELFVIVKKILTILGILEIKGLKYGPLIRVLLGLVTILVELYTILTTGWYFAFGSRTFEQRAEGAILVVAANSTQMTFLALYAERAALVRLVAKIQHVAERREALFARNIYPEACERVEKMSYQASLLVFCGTLPCYAAPALILSCFSYYVMDKPAELAFKLPSPASYPYDWHTPMAYSFTAIAYIVQLYYIAFIYLTFTCMFLGFCTFLSAFATDSAERLNDAEKEIQSYINRRHTIQSQQPLMKPIHDFIAIHSEAKQLATECNELYRPLLIAYLYSCGPYCCMCLLEFNAFIETSNLLLLEVAVSGICALLPILSMICYVGEGVRTKYLQLNDAIYDVSWYLYPVKLEKLVPLMLMHAEKPAKFESVGGLDCSLETLKTIIKCGYTFFMALRGL